MVRRSGAIGTRVITASWSTASLVTGTTRMLRTSSKLLPRSARDWMSALPTRSSPRSEEHTSELQSRRDLVCRLLLEKKKKKHKKIKSKKENNKKKQSTKSRQ